MQTAIKFKSVDEYFDTFSTDVKKILEVLQNTIKQAAPTPRRN